MLATKIFPRQAPHLKNRLEPEEGALYGFFVEAAAFAALSPVELSDVQISRPPASAILLRLD